MRHPRTGTPATPAGIPAQRLNWEWLVDYYHACERLTKLAEALLGAGREAAAWASKQRRVLRDKPGGVARVLASARALRRQGGLVGCRKDFDQALNYLRNHRRHMRYAEARRRGLPIGSGVTEAACKTLVGQRFKQSGMRWKAGQGQHVLDLRVLLKSGVWPPCRARWLAAASRPQPVHLAALPFHSATIQPENLLLA